MSFSPRLTTRFPKHLGIWFTYCVQTASKRKVSEKRCLLPHCIVYHPLSPWSVCVSDLRSLFILPLDDSLIQGLKIWDFINTVKEFSIRHDGIRHAPLCLPSAAPFTTTKNLKQKNWRSSFPRDGYRCYLVLDKYITLPPTHHHVFF